MYDLSLFSLLFWVCFLQVDLFLLLLSAQTSSFSICCKASLVGLSFLNFCLSGNLLLSPSNLKYSLAGQSILGCSFFPFITLNVSCHSLLACKVSVEKSADCLMGVPLYIICHFSLLLLIFYLSLIFVNLITMCLSVFLLGFILPRTLCASWAWLVIFFPMLGEFSAIISSNIFLSPFSLSFWASSNENVGALNVVPEDSQAVFISLHFNFFLYSVLWQ